MNSDSPTTESAGKIFEIMGEVYAHRANGPSSFLPLSDIFADKSLSFTLDNGPALRYTNRSGEGGYSDSDSTPVIDRRHAPSMTPFSAA
jgi:hypothetical protein